MENILGYLGFMIICSLSFALCGIVGFMILHVLGDASQKISAELSKTRYFKAFKDILPIVITGLFLGVCIGAAFKLMFNISFATSMGATTGLILSSAVGIYLIPRRWNRCYLGNHETFSVPGRDGDVGSSSNYSSYIACKFCDMTWSDGGSRPY